MDRHVLPTFWETWHKWRPLHVSLLLQWQVRGSKVGIVNHCQGNNKLPQPLKCHASILRDYKESIDKWHYWIGENFWVFCVLASRLFNDHSAYWIWINQGWRLSQGSLNPRVAFLIKAYYANVTVIKGGIILCNSPVLQEQNKTRINTPSACTGVNYNGLE